jgi:hypothetical protein
VKNDEDLALFRSAFFLTSLLSEEEGEGSSFLSAFLGLLPLFLYTTCFLAIASEAERPVLGFPFRFSMIRFWKGRETPEWGSLLCSFFF